MFGCDVLCIVSCVLLMFVGWWILFLCVVFVGDVVCVFVMMFVCGCWVFN